MKTSLTAVAVSAILLSTGASAGDDEGAQQATTAMVAAFEALDRNGDQQISRTEAAGEKLLSDSFATVDANGDGYVSKAEYMARTKS
jgi:Ca2+-binding EF-hand superfamily protein